MEQVVSEFSEDRGLFSNGEGFVADLLFSEIWEGRLEIECEFLVCTFVIFLLESRRSIKGGSRKWNLIGLTASGAVLGFG